ncbi:MAG: GtrA family protein [Rikenellaceae bacterium]
MSKFIAKVVTWFVDLFYLPPLQQYIPHHLFRYFFCGVCNYFILDTVLYFVLYNYVVGHRYFDMGFVVVSPHVLAMLIVFPITFFVGFWLNRHVAFNSTAQRAKVQLLKYVVSIVGSLIISYVVLKFLVESCGVWATPAKVTASVVTAVYSYLMARYFTFTKR